MSVMPVWLFIAASIAICALIAFPLRLDSARLACLLRTRALSRGAGQRPPSIYRTGYLVAGVFLLVAGFGVVATSYVGGKLRATGSTPPPRSGSHEDMLARLAGYTGALGAEKPPSTPASGKMLPDVNTMIRRLAARLQTTPGDISGWRMLGWSYFHTGRYREATEAYAKAVALDPSSAALKSSYEEAKAKASETASPLPAESVGKGGEGPSVETKSAPEAMLKGEHDAIRAMVDGLAARLEHSPGDVEGWTRLMRSRVVLGETEDAARAFRKALEVFKNDAAASDKISAAAIELGLKVE